MFKLFLISLVILAIGILIGAGGCYYALRNNPAIKTKLDKVNDILASGKLDEDTLAKLKDAIK
jgi:hypothetical protein